MTADELFHMPHGNYRYELVRGVLRKMTPAGFKHGAVIANLTSLLTRHVKERSLGIVTGAETGYKLAFSPDTVRAPDVGFVRADRIPSSGPPEAFFPGPPDLAVEVLSPDDRPSEVAEKVRDWIDSGTPMVWVIDPKKGSARVYRADGAIGTVAATESLDGMEIVPGFTCRLPEVLV